MPLGIGAKLARPDSPVVILVGDGGFAHSWAELETLVRSEINLTVVVLNNGVLGYPERCRDGEIRRVHDSLSLRPVDHAVISKACGCEAIIVKNPDDIGSAFDRALSSKTPVLIEVLSDPDAHPPISLLRAPLATVFANWASQVGM